MKKYLVMFTVPFTNGWGKHCTYDAVAVVEDDKGEMPYGWQPTEIGGENVEEIKLIVPILFSDALPLTVVSGEYDRPLPPLNVGDVFVINAETMGSADALQADGEYDELIDGLPMPETFPHKPTLGGPN